eukprot:gene1594-12719_t
MNESSLKKLFIDHKFYFIITLIIFSLILRTSVSFHGFSGKNQEPKHGDFEAQRHWMEITNNLPLRDWYVNSTKNDLLYWGLDYPPLTAYHSFLVGKIISNFYPEMIEFEQSRGIETKETIFFMRLSVIISDLVYLSSCIFFILSTYEEDEQFIGLLLLLIQPGLILIDNGHFQYNSVCLGLFIYSITFILNDNPYLGSLFFCLSLNFKQIRKYKILKIIKIGCIVILTFSILWFPFFNAGVVKNVFIRIFPVQRGLFEDKVATFWCTISTFFKFQKYFNLNDLFKISLILTLIGISIPSFYLYFKPTKQRLLFSLLNSSLSFYLFSFHVHEKTILFPITICFN